MPVIGLELQCMEIVECLWHCRYQMEDFSGVALAEAEAEREKMPSFIPPYLFNNHVSAYNGVSTSPILRNQVNVHCQIVLIFTVTIILYHWQHIYGVIFIFHINFMLLT